MIRLRNKPAEDAVIEKALIPSQRRYAMTPQIDSALAKRSKIKSRAVWLHFVSAPLLFAVPQFMYAMGWANPDLSQGAMVTAVVAASLVVWNVAVVSLKNRMVGSSVAAELVNDAMPSRIAEDFLVPVETVESAVYLIATGADFGNDGKRAVDFVYDGRRVSITMSEGNGRQINSTTRYLTVECRRHRSVNDSLVMV
jgi:hypothetical protein